MLDELILRSADTIDKSSGELSSMWPRAHKSLRAFVLFVVTSASAIVLAARAEAGVSPNSLPVNTVITTITAGKSPGPLLVSPDSSTVYVANYLSNNVSVIDAVGDTVENSIFAGPMA